MIEIGDLKKTAERLSRLVNQLVRLYGAEPVDREKEKAALSLTPSPGQHPQSCFPSWLP